MTTTAERLRESHRGARRSAPASESRLAALQTFGLRFEKIDDFNVIVEGAYQLNLALSFWRAIDGPSQGYLVSALNDQIRNPAAGRDSVAASDRTLATQSAAVAESAAGTGWTDALMERAAWP